MANPSLSVKRVFFKNDNSSDPTVEFEYGLDTDDIVLLDI
jgi:hypothetical protein